jgi:hypothetical protein
MKVGSIESPSNNACHEEEEEEEEVGVEVRPRSVGRWISPLNTSIDPTTERGREREIVCVCVCVCDARAP